MRIFELENYLEEYWRKKAALNPRQHLSVEMAKYQISTGGKRIRALLPLFIFEIYGKNPLDAIPLGAAIEVIHNATLVHDDLQDGDEVRRNQPTVWKKYSSAQAINAGDAMFYMALEMIKDLKISPEISSKVLGQIVTDTLKVIEGQAQEFLMKSESYPGMSRYVEVISGKTSGLFKMPICSALLTLGAAPSELILSEKYANLAGQLFQIHDDYIDLFGDKKRGQKAMDIAEGKVSYFVAYVNDHGAESQKSDLNAILSKPREQTTSQMIDSGLEIILSTGAKEACEKQMRKHREDILNSVELQENKKLYFLFTDLVSKIINI